MVDTEEDTGFMFDFAYKMDLKERLVVYNKHIKATKSKWHLDDNQPYCTSDDFYYQLKRIIKKESFLIKNLNEDEQNEDLEELYKIITMCIGQDFELVDKELLGKPIDPSDEYGTYYRIVFGSFAAIEEMSQLCQGIKRFDTERMYLKMATDFILRSFDKNGHFNQIDLILSKSKWIVHSYIVCMKQCNQVQIALEDITAIISSFERLGAKKPRNYGYLLLAKGEALEAVNKLDEAILEYKKSIKCSKKYYLYHINTYSDPDHHELVRVYEEPTDHLCKLYANLGRHQEAIEVLEKFFETIGPSVDQTEVLHIEEMKLNLAKSYMKIRQFSEAKQSLLSITHVIRDETKKSLASKPLSEFLGSKMSFISVFDVLELYLHCIELKPSSKKKTLPKIAQHGRQ